MPQEQLLIQLKEFLVSSSKHGYAASNSKDEANGSHTLSWQDGDFKFHDNYFGGEPFAGQEVVFIKNRPFWTSVYYGYLTNFSKSAHEVYKFLKKALLEYNHEFPVRGPQKFKDGDWSYEMTYHGDLKNYAGNESIYFQNKQLYKCRFQGGLVDVKRGE